MRRALILCAALLLAAVPAFARGGAQPAAEEQITLRFSWWGDESRHSATLAAIDIFTQENPTIRFEPEYGGWDGYYTKLATMVAGGAAPDIMQTDVKFMPDILAQGQVFYDLSKLSDVIDMSGFDSLFVKNWGVFGGTTVGLPTGINGQTVILNLTLAREVGLDPATEWDWNKMLETGKALHAARPDLNFLLLDPAQALEHIVWPQLRQAVGDQVVSPDYVRRFTQAQLESSLSYVVAMLDTGAMVPFEQSAVFSVNQMENPKWTNGDVVMYLNYTTHVVSAIANAPDIEVGVARFPIPAGAKQSGIAVQPAQLLTISADTRHPRESGRFLDFFFNSEKAAIALKLVRSVPATIQARNFLEAASLLDPTLNRAVNIAVNNGGIAPSNIIRNAELTKIMADAVEAVGFHRATPAAAAAAALKEFDAKLADLKAEL